MAPDGAPGPHGDAVAVARALLRRGGAASLATVGDDGAPWASLVAVADGPGGEPLLCLSALAEHERNLARDPRASLLLWAPVGDDPLAGDRVTLAGRTEPVSDAGRAAARAAYLRGVPSAAAHVDLGDFVLRRLRVERVRWVGGPGRMGSADGAALRGAAA